MKIPNTLLQKIQNDYISIKHQDGVYTFTALDNDIINIVIKSFLSWAEDTKIISEDKLDLSDIKKW